MKSTLITFAEDNKYSLALGGKFLGDTRSKIELLPSYVEVTSLRTCRVVLWFCLTHRVLCDTGEATITAKYKEILKLSSVGGMDFLSRFECPTPIVTFKKHRLTYYLVPTRNVRTGIGYSPAAEAMSQPFFCGQVSQFPTGTAVWAGGWQAAWLPATAQHWLSSLAFSGFKIIWHPLSRRSCRVQLWGVGKEVSNGMWSSRGKAVWCSWHYWWLLILYCCIYVRLEGQLLF